MAFLQQDLRLRPFEIDTVLDLFLCLLDGVFHLLQVHFGNNIKRMVRWHRAPIITEIALSINSAGDSRSGQEVQHTFKVGGTYIVANSRTEDAGAFIGGVVYFGAVSEAVLAQVPQRLPALTGLEGEGDAVALSADLGGAPRR